MKRQSPRVTRREFTAGMTGLLACSSVKGATGNDVSKLLPLRTIAYNVLQCTGYPSMPKGQTPRPVDDMADLFAKTLSAYDPDIVTFSESPKEPVSRAIADRLRMQCLYFPSGEWWPGTLMTRLQVVRSQNCPMREGTRPADLFTRHWFMAVLRRGNEDLVLHNLHLHPNNNEVRAREVTEVLKSLEPDMKAHRSIILQGDFNHTPLMPEYQRWLEAGFLDTFGTEAKTVLTFPSDEPNRRLDYVLAYGPIAARIKKAHRLDEGQLRKKPGDAWSFALSDHLPVFAAFE